MTSVKTRIKDVPKCMRRRAEIDAFFSMIPEILKTKKTKSLEVACGDGFFIRRVRGKFPPWETDGIDINPLSIAMSGEASCVIGDAAKLPFPNGTFDIVYSICFHYKGKELTDLHKWLSESLRVLKPKGYMLVVGADWHIADVEKAIPNGFKVLKRRDGGVLASALLMQKRGR